MFKDSWLKQEQYKTWLKNDGIRYAQCILHVYALFINVFNMGECALKSHVNGSSRT